ncbi:TPA: hypothetical protein DCE37_19005, partial [Candidatus Latescibacteria bacterium]|nr:hypothetical protein [Candidatus Latescibacterota bacterium]
MKLLSLVLTLLVAAPSWAQSTGTLTGSVRDVQGATLPGANIKVSGSALSSPIRGATDTDGAYTVSPLPAGTYEVTASYVGFVSKSQMVD